MKSNYLKRFPVLLIVMCGLIQISSAQQGQISFPNDVVVSINTAENIGTKGLSNIYVSSGNDENLVHRVMVDRKNKIYFGYDLEVLTAAGSKRMEIFVKPLSIGKVSDVIKTVGSANDLSFRALPKYPDKITIQSGDTVVLDLLENVRTKEKISDSIKVTRGTSKSFTYVSDNRSPRDFSLGDVQISLIGFEAYIGSEKVKFSGGGMSGAVLWVYFPSKGRFILSPIAQENSGFRKIGLIDDKTISFDYEGTTYRFVSNHPVLGNGGKWNLWVMYDGNYKPPVESSSETPISFGATNKPEYLFDNR